MPQQRTARPRRKADEPEVNAATPQSEHTPPGDDWTLAQRLAWVQAQVIRLGHDTDVTTGGGGTYKATSIDAMADMTRPLLAEAGVAMWPKRTELLSIDEVVSGGGSKGFHAIIRCEWVIRGGAEQALGSSLGEAIDYSDKVINKCHTYARKNLLVAMLNLSTGENPEAESPEAGHVRLTVTGPRPRPAPEPSPEERAGKRWQVLVGRAEAADIDPTSLEVKVREKIGDELPWPVLLLDDANRAEAQKVLIDMLVEKGAMTEDAAAKAKEGLTASSGEPY